MLERDQDLHVVCDLHELHGIDDESRIEALSFISTGLMISFFLYHDAKARRLSLRRYQPSARHSDLPFSVGSREVENFLDLVGISGDVGFEANAIIVDGCIEV